MLGPNDLCLCCGTIARASFEELLEATVAGGFSGLSIWPRHYESALASGLSDRGMRRMINQEKILFKDDHLSQLSAAVRAGEWGRCDVAVVEAVAVTAKGHLIPTMSVGNTPT